MIIKGEQFVAKKLVDTGNGRGHIPLPEAVRFLSADLVRLKRMEYFAKAFFTRGEQEGAELTCMVFLVILLYIVHLLTMVHRLSSIKRLSHQGLHRQAKSWSRRTIWRPNKHHRNTKSHISLSGRTPTRVFSHIEIFRCSRNALSFWQTVCNYHGL